MLMKNSLKDTHDKEEAMTIAAIKERILQTYTDADVQVSDLTGTSDHISVTIISDKFKGVSRIQRQRMVMDVFAEELKTGEVHALTIQAKSLEEK